jgi:GT2 family glycosyltransferase
VDQSDGDATKNILEPLAATDNRLRYLPTTTRGLSRARNVGAQAAHGRLLVCTDDDCEVSQTWLTEVQSAFEANPEVQMAYGQVHAPEGADFETLYVPCSYFSERRALDREVLGMGAHMILTKNLWERVGGWDEALGGGAVFPGAEDFDFSYRAQRLGALVMALPELVLIHRTGRPKAFYFEKHLFDYGLGEAAFCLKHVRCGDLWALKRLVRVLALYSGRAVWRSLRRRPDATGFLRGLVVGLVRAPRLGLDREKRAYTP